MFGSLIRRKTAQIEPGAIDDSAFDSTTFSLSTAVPRPTERRNDDRVAPILRIAKLVTGKGELLAGRKQRHGFRARPPRLDISCKASVRVGKLYYSVDVHDISLEGMKVEPIEEYCVGKKVVVVVESLRPIKGEVRWYSDRRAGIVFDKPLDFDELTEWVGKRLELASLKASYQKG